MLSVVVHRENEILRIIPFPPELPVEAPPQIQINIPLSTLRSDWLRMINNEHLSDIQFHYKSDCYHGHRVALCIASELFRQIFEVARKVKIGESLVRCETWSRERLQAINRQSIRDGAVAAFKNIYDK